MNVLPFVFAVFAIFTFLSNSLLKDTKETAVLMSKMEDFYQLQQSYYNGAAGLKYKSLTTKEPVDSITPKTEPPKIEYQSPRLSARILKGSQLNLYPLIQEKEAKNHPFYAITERLLCLLYPDIMPNKLAAQALLDALLIKAKTVKKPILSELMPEDPLLQEKYYKMLKGTNQYDVIQKKGIPPLADFFMIREGKACCYLRSAHFFVLQAIFGKEFAHTIIEREKQKWESGKAKVLNKKELEALIMQYPVQAAIYEPIKKYCRAALLKKTAAPKKTQNGMSFCKES